MKKLIVALLGIYTSLSVNAQAVYTWNKTTGGSWSASGNWTPARTSPASSDVLLVNNGSTQTITNVQTQTIGRLIISGNSAVTLMPGGSARTLTISNSGLALDIQPGSQLNITGESGSGTRSLTLRFSGAGNTVNIAGKLQMETAGNDRGIINLTNTNTAVTGELINAGGTIGSSTGNLQFAAGGIYQHAVNGGSVPNAAWDAASECRFTGITNTLPSALNQSFGNFNWDSPLQSASLNLGGQLTSVNGDFTLNNTGGSSGLYLTTTANSNYNLTIGGNLIVRSGAWLVVSGGDNVTGTVTVTGNTEISSAAADCGIYLHYGTGGSMTLNKIILNVQGDFNQTGGLFDMANGNSNSNNFTELHLSGDFSLNGNGIFYTGTSDNSIANGMLVFQKNGTQTYYSEIPANMPYVNYTIGNGSTLKLLSPVELSSSGTAVWAGKFIVSDGGTLDAGTEHITSSTGSSAGVNNSFELASGGKIITANSGGLEQDAANGTISTALSSRIFSSDAVYEFRTAVMGSFITSPLANTMRSLLVNNSTVVLSQPVTVTSSVELLSGVLTTSMTNLLTVADNAIAAGGSYAPLRYIDGPVRKTGNDAFTFPVGKNGIYAPASISAPAAVTAEFRAEYFRGSPPNRTQITAPGLAQISFCEYWDLEEVGPGSPSVNVTLSWSGLSPCNAASYITDLTDLTVAHFDGTNWNSEGNSGGHAGSAAQGQVTRNNVSSFSIFTLGSTSAATNPLSVKFTAINAHIDGGYNVVEWSNLSETGVNYYTLEKSATGNVFETVTSRNARSNNGGKETYTVTDPDNSPVIYYRVKAVELNGEISYSKVLKLTREHAATDILAVYPNPVTQQQFMLQCRSGIRETLKLELYNNAGVLIQRNSWQHPGGLAVQTIELPAKIRPGIYLIRVTGSSVNQVCKLIVQ